MAKAIVLDERTRLDKIAKAAMGTERDGAVEALLAANPGLAARGPYAPHGTELALPKRVDRPAPARPLTRPWE